MVEKKIQLKSGFEATHASMFVSFASLFMNTDITFIYGSKKANAKSILNLLSLGIKTGSDIIVQINGEKEKEVAEKITLHFEAQQK